MDKERLSKFLNYPLVQAALANKDLEKVDGLVVDAKMEWDFYAYLEVNDLAISYITALGRVPANFFTRNSLTGSDIQSFDIPVGTESIGHGAFWMCTKLKKITIPNTVEEIGSEAFEWCESLESISIPNSVVEIGIYAFGFCRSLKSITIPERFKDQMEGIFSKSVEDPGINITYI